VTHYLFEKTQGSPIVIPVVNIVGGGANNNSKKENIKDKPKTNEEIVQDQQKRFQEMRQRLLSQDARVD
jgi:hypothetical protein